MPTLHGTFEGYFVGLPTSGADPRGVARCHDLRLDWGALRPARLSVAAPADAPADPSPMQWTVLGPILAELEDGRWYRLWLHDARLHWSRPRLARDDGDRSLWCVRGHLVGEIATGRLEAAHSAQADGWPTALGAWARPGCLLGLLAVLGLLVHARAWIPGLALLALLALPGWLAASRAWPARSRALGEVPAFAWLLALALAWLLLHWSLAACTPIPGLLWLALVAGALLAARRAGRLGGPLLLLLLGLPLSLVGWQRTACVTSAPRPVGAAPRSASDGAVDARGAASPEAAPAGDPGAMDRAAAPAGDASASTAGDDEDAVGPGAPSASGELPSLPAPDHDADLLQQASRGRNRRIGLDAALAQGSLDCGQTIHMSGDLLFPVDSAQLRPASLPQLRKLYRVVSASPEVEVSLVGHADVTGEPEYNQALSHERARAVGDWLLRWRALPPARLRLAGRGEAEPIIDTEPGSPLQRLNRRVDVVVSCPGEMSDAGE